MPSKPRSVTDRTPKEWVATGIIGLLMVGLVVGTVAGIIHLIINSPTVILLILAAIALWGVYKGIAWAADTLDNREERLNNNGKA